MEHSHCVLVSANSDDAFDLKECMSVQLKTSQCVMLMLKLSEKLTSTILARLECSSSEVGWSVGNRGGALTRAWKRLRTRLIRVTRDSDLN